MFIRIRARAPHQASRLGTCGPAISSLLGDPPDLIPYFKAYVTINTVPHGLVFQFINGFTDTVEKLFLLEEKVDFIHRFEPEDKVT